MSEQWIDQEFAGLDHGDARLNRRTKNLVERLSGKPAASIPEACDSWSETCAVYRFLRNPEVTWDVIWAPRWASTQHRMRKYSVVLCIQDATELDFNGQDIEGSGAVNYEARKGMYLHPTYAVSREREARGADGVRGGQRESTRWGEGYERQAEMAVDMPHTRLVYVADREADMVVLMRRSNGLGTPVDWLVRACHDRCLSENEGVKLWADRFAYKTMARPKQPR
ncbi:hypothetical protein AWB78_08509 [Caballeronia calidae]|uniref:Transposase Tn5-like N-terminal domain-containing protein n=1 Tax=Caballeronia calidae TaxID=1777139 RepID=A0A158EKE6_9BURK|nr:hypothetical protein AWB78_08509 [Caballeronia calidae]